MKLSFIVPVYNAEKYIKRCLDSLLDQNIDDYEIICIDDGSSDGSKLVLEDYKKHYPEKIILKSQDNQGIGPTRNTAFKSVRGEYTWFIDNDDCIRSNCLKEIIMLLDQYNSDITNISYYKGFFTTSPFENQKLEQLTIRKINQDNAMYFYDDAPWSKIYRTDFLKKNKLFFENIFGEDTSVTFDLYSKTKNIFKIDQPLYAWFERKDSFSHAVYSKKHFDTFPVLLEVLKEQSEKADKSLKIFYENLMLRKADIYLPHFKNAEVTDELKVCRDECVKKSEEILKKLDSNLLYEIYLENKKETENKLRLQEKKLINKYENSLSWKFSLPIRLIGKLFR